MQKKRTIKQSGEFTGPNDHLKPMQPRRAVPLALLSIGKDGNPAIDNSLIFDTREKFIPLNTTRPYKLNANTTGVCMFGIV